MEPGGRIQDHGPVLTGPRSVRTLIALL